MNDFYPNIVPIQQRAELTIGHFNLHQKVPEPFGLG